MRINTKIDGKDSFIETKVGIKSADGSITDVDTEGLLGLRYVTDFGIEGGRQYVTVSLTRKGLSKPLVTDGGTKIPVVLDSKKGVINPYLSLGPWSIRESEDLPNGDIKIWGSKYPYNLQELPSYLPVTYGSYKVDVNTNNKDAASVSNRLKSATGSNTGSSSMTDWLLVTAAGVVATVLSSDRNKSDEPHGTDAENYLPRYGSGGKNFMARIVNSIY